MAATASISNENKRRHCAATHSNSISILWFVSFLSFQSFTYLNGCLVLRRRASYMMIAGSQLEALNTPFSGIIQIVHRNDR